MFECLLLVFLVAVINSNPIKEYLNQTKNFFWDAPYSSSSIALSPKEIERRQLDLYSKVVLFLSSMGWIVAIYNTSQMKIGKFDVGILTFIPCIVSSVLLMRNSRNIVGSNENGKGEFMSTGIYGRACVLACHIVVILNYLVGLLLALTIGSHIYLNFAIVNLLGVIIWLVCAVVGWSIMTRTLETHAEENPEANNELEDLYGFRQVRPGE